MENILESEIRSDFFKLNRWLLKNNKELFDKLVLYNEMYNRLKIAMYVHDLKLLRHIWINASYEQITGYNNEELMQMGPEWAFDSYHPDDRYIMQERISFFREDRGDSYSGMYRIRHKNGQWVWLYSNCAVYQRNRAGKPQQLFGIALDITGNLSRIKHLLQCGTLAG